MGCGESKSEKKKDDQSLNIKGQAKQQKKKEKE